jgi:nitroimidazol reductase NimA-like FMN-containing flavoprotein (pyridoxamine 5'-phosphate oxidase superfamily)
MTSWNDIAADSPDLASLVQARFESTGLGYLATLRKDGSPRLCGIEPSFQDGELLLGSMPEARKAIDLQRDPRFALHAASIDKEVKEGDVKVAGRAVEVLDDEEKLVFLKQFEEANGYAPPPGPMHLFRCDITEVVATRVAGDHLLIESWHEGRGYQRVERA